MFTKKPFAILYIDRDKFTYYTETSSPLTFTYPVDSIKELEVMNETLLVKEATTYILSNKIQPSIVMFVLSHDVVYEKEFLDEVQNIQPKTTEQKETTSPSIQNPIAEAEQKHMQNTEQKTEQSSANSNGQTTVPAKEQHMLTVEERARLVQSFIDIVPIEEVASKTYKIDKGVKVVVTNKRLYEVLLNLFTKQTFVVDSVVPITVINKEILPEQKMDQDAAIKLITKFEVVKQNSLLEENSYALTNPPAEMHGIKMTTKVTSKREFILIGVFVLLMLVLGIVSYTTFIAPKSKTRVAAISQQPTLTLPSPTVVPTITPTPVPTVAIKKANVLIKINGGTAAQENLIRQSFISLGFSRVLLKPGTTPTTGKAFVIFSATLPTETKDLILQQLKQSVISVSAQQAVAPEADVIINL